MRLATLLIQTATLTILLWLVILMVTSCGASTEPFEPSKVGPYNGEYYLFCTEGIPVLSAYYNEEWVEGRFDCGRPDCVEVFASLCGGAWGLLR